MAEPNPAEFMVTLLHAVRDGGVLRQNGLWEEEAAEEGTFRNALGLTEVGATRLIEALTATINVIDWLHREAESFSPKKKERYQNACEHVRNRLDWEFGFPNLRKDSEPQLRLAALISEFEHFAIELEEKNDFPDIDTQKLEEISWRLNEIEVEIEACEMPSELKYAMLDSIDSIRKSIRHLTVYSSASAAESLKNALGRMGITQMKVNREAAPASYVTNLVSELWKTFAAVAGYAEVVGKFKALPELAKSMMEVNK